MQDRVRIEWKYEGKNDFSSGTGAYASEKALAWLAALAAPGFLALFAWRQAVDWNAAQYAVAFLLALDIGGGLVSNALNSCKRFYHTPPKKQEGRLGVVLKNPALFAAFHVHPLVVGWLHGQGNWTFGLAWYGLYLGSVALVLLTPLYLKRPVAMLLIMAAFLVNLYVIEPVAGFEWLMPLLCIKIVYGHLVREEPYRKPAKKGEEPG